MIVLPSFESSSSLSPNVTVVAVSKGFKYQSTIFTNRNITEKPFFASYVQTHNIGVPEEKSLRL